MEDTDRARIVEGATVSDASGNVVDLANLRPDGTIGAPDETETPELVEVTADQSAEVSENA